MYSIILPKEYTYGEIQELIYSYKGLYPFIKLEEIGTSVLGRSIQSISLGKASERVLYVGGIHGCERLTTLVILKFIETLAKAISEDGEISETVARKIMRGRAIQFVPLLNPDGYEISLRGRVAAGEYSKSVGKISGGDTKKWSANARGVDINHNFNAGWHTLQELERKLNISGPSISRFGGFAPESEPETTCITELCRNNNIRHLMAFHSQGQEIYWKYGDNTPTKSKYMAKILEASSGYTMAQPEEIASHGGLKDWFIQEFGKPGFTIEIGKGENPLDAGTLDEIYSQIEELMLIGMIF